MKIEPVDCVTELFAYTYHLVEQIEQMEYDQVLENYTRIIDKAKACAKDAGIPKKKFDEALFAVFAWVDETIFALAWKHKPEWIRNSLQKRYFNTTSAGSQFFTNLEKLGPDDEDIIEVYDYCLSSGFKGSMYESYDQEKLKSIKQDTVKRSQGETGLEVPEILFPEAGNKAFNKRLKRKRWKGMSNLTSLFVLLPILLFLVLYYFFNEQLAQIVNNFGL